MPCPSCDGNLYNDRSNFSKNQTLFPVFGLDGAPLWCIVQSMLCRKCKRRFDANSSAVLLKLPAYVALTYPVATKYAFPNRNCHLNENATKVFDHLMLTYTNGCQSPLVQHFNPKVMYSDTWPHKKEYWYTMIKDVEGRLGLFHYEKRIIHTLRKKHIDHTDALADLLNSIYYYCPQDFENLLTSLKTGTLSPTAKKHSADEINDLIGTKIFRDRYGKYLKKNLHKPETMRQKLDEWFCKYKVVSSDPINKPAGGRLDPLLHVSLFTPDTKSAVENCIEKAPFLSDPLPIKKMYDQIPPHPESKHGLVEYISKHGESKLEAFHDRMAHFGNCGVGDSLADNLNLAGTARHNLSVRHKRSLIVKEDTRCENTADDTSFSLTSRLKERKKIPAGWEMLEDVCVHNHGVLEVSTSRSTASSSNSSNNNTTVISTQLICLPTNGSLNPTLCRNCPARANRSGRSCR